MYLFLCCMGVCLDKIYQLQPPGKINLAGHSETRLQIQSRMRQPFREISGLLSTREFRWCLFSEQIMIYCWERDRDRVREERKTPWLVFVFNEYTLEHQYLKGCQKIRGESTNILVSHRWWTIYDGRCWKQIQNSNFHFTSTIEEVIKIVNKK